MPAFSCPSAARTLLSWTCAAVLVITANALYSRKGPVAQLTPKTFGKAVLDSDLPAAVEFYAPWSVRVSEHYDLT